MQNSNSIQLSALNTLYDGLMEEGWPWDWTTRGVLGSTHFPAISRVIAKSNGVWSGEALVQALPELARKFGEQVELKSSFKDGTKVRRGQKVAEWSTAASFALAVERPFLNLAAYMSGIATQTSALVLEVQKAWKRSVFHSKPPRITATRKTLPGYRDLALHSVLVGGGFSHRLNIASGILIKENHITAAGGIKNAIQGVTSSAPHLFKTEIEIRNLKELKVALEAGVDAVMLDNFSPSEVQSALRFIKNFKRLVIVEVSGGINIRNISKYALAGVHIISSGSLTHSVQAMDLSILMDGPKDPA